ncbi:MAG: TetR/AcrR family transcriptional regulator [Mameliella sp.]|nr:TetR/AcrR family transcriptional regulator [Phaeodactylibacter sp.]NRA51903.1 TetR/AcrR family transcriptional regulator [Phaeodactylibacter sp.]
MLKARDPQEKNLRKQHILDSAETVLQSKGLQKFSISDVAKAAKLAPGTLYLYFKKKEDIIAQLTIRSRHKLLQHFHESIQKADDPLEQFRNILFANFDFYKANKLYYDLVSFYEVNGIDNEPVELQQASQNISSLVVAVLDRAKTQGLIRENINVTQFTYATWAMCNGMVQMVDLRGHHIKAALNESSHDFYASFVDFVIQGIKA